MKNIFIACMLIIITALSARAQFIKFNLVGKMKNVPDGAVLFLTYPDINGKEKTDSAKISSSQPSFSFSGMAKEPVPARLFLSPQGRFALKKNSDITTVILEAGKISVSGNDSIATAKIGGGVENAFNEQYKATINPVSKRNNNKLFNLTPEIRNSPERLATFKKEYYQMQEEKQQLIKSFIAQHPQALISLYALKDYAGPILKVQEVEPLFIGLNKAVKESAAGRSFTHQLNLAKRTGIGSPAPDFVSTDTAGRKVRLSDFKGNYVLLDFWASWCAPCRAENPNLVKAYHRYKDKKFTILSVSIDSPNAKKAWLGAVRHDGLEWTNVSDLNGWNNAAARLYGINAVPQSFLIGPDGNIAAKNLRDNELNQWLQDHLIQ